MLHLLTTLPCAGAARPTQIQRLANALCDRTTRRARRVAKRRTSANAKPMYPPFPPPPTISALRVQPTLRKQRRLYRNVVVPRDWRPVHSTRTVRTGSLSSMSRSPLPGGALVLAPASHGPFKRAPAQGHSPSLVPGSAVADLCGSPAACYPAWDSLAASRNQSSVTVEQDALAPPCSMPRRVCNSVDQSSGAPPPATCSPPEPGSGRPAARL